VLEQVVVESVFDDDLGVPHASGGVRVIGREMHIDLG
jgi:hypothetical protein